MAKIMYFKKYKSIFLKLKRLDKYFFNVYEYLK